jgi:capsular polysaccharide biosynthesis protein
MKRPTVLSDFSHLLELETLSAIERQFLEGLALRYQRQETQNGLKFSLSLLDELSLLHPIPPLRYRLIAKDPATEGGLISYLKRGRLYLQYSRYFKKFWPSRVLVNWLQRNLFLPTIKFKSIYFSWISANDWRPIVKLYDYANLSSLSITEVFDAAKVETPLPRVFPAKDQSYLESPQDCYIFPPVYIAEVSEGLVNGGTNFIFVDNAAICHDLYNFKQDYTSEELHGRHVIDVKNMRMRILREDSKPENIEVAATFIDACASNYAHWLSEVLPRISSFCSVKKFEKIPIIVNYGLHKNIMESLAFLVGSEREIILLPVGRSISVKRLYVTSATGYLPFEQRGEPVVNFSHGLFSPPPLDLIRKQLFTLFDELQAQELPQKIYLCRDSGVRKLNNSLKIEREFALRGYIFVEPEKLTFLQQVVLFANAKEVAAPTGAALANAIFCKTGTQIIIFMSKHKKMIYRYWLNMFSPFGFQITYLLGKIDANHSLGLHGDYSLALNDVRDFLTFNKRNE